MCGRHQIGMSERMSGELEFRRVPAGAGDAAALVAAIVAEIAELHDGLDLNALDMGYRDGAARRWRTPPGNSATAAPDRGALGRTR